MGKGVCYLLSDRGQFIFLSYFHSNTPDTYCHCICHSDMKNNTLKKTEKAVDFHDIKNSHEMQGKDHFRKTLEDTVRCSYTT